MMFIQRLAKQTLTYEVLGDLATELGHLLASGPGRLTAADARKLRLSILKGKKDISSEYVILKGQADILINVLFAYEGSQQDREIVDEISAIMHL